MMTQILHAGTSNLLLTSLVGWLVMVNLLAFMAFFLDHRRALAGEGAMPEMPLLLLSTMGGWVGAQLGRLSFQSQSHERAFGIFLNVSILPMLALAAMMAAQDVDWASMTTKVTDLIAAQTASPADETAVAGAAPEAVAPVVTKPAVKDTAKKAAVKKAAVKKAAVKDVSLTANPDLPKRIGPGSKKAAWQSR
jgi:uncharacterized membrane protein YsdA (DUF1294 family)